MRYTDILKRAVPFIATFVLGLFVASFFVTISAPKVGYKRHYKKDSCSKKFRMESERRVVEVPIRSVERRMPDGTIQRFEVPPPPPPPRVVTPYEGDLPVLTEEERQILENAARESRR